MDIQQFLNELRAERDGLDAAISALQAISGTASIVRRGRPTKAAQPRKRVLSAKARKAISDAAKRRWAAQKAKEAKK